MASTTILRLKNLDVSKLTFSDVKHLQSGGKTVYINYDGSKGVFQTPVCFAPYGIQLPMNVTEDSPASKKSYSIEVSLSGMESVPEVKLLFTTLREIEEWVIKAAFKNSVLWFGQQYTIDGLRALFQPIIKYSKDKNTGKIKTEYPPTFKVKLPWSPEKDEFTFPCCDMEKNEINLNDIRKNMKGGRTRLLTQIAGVWLIGGKFGVQFKAHQGQFEPIIQGKGGAFAFEDSDDEDEVPKSVKAKAHAQKIEFDHDLAEEVEQLAALSVSTKKPPTVAPVVAVEDDDEAEEEEDEPVAPTPVAAKKQPVKKAVSPPAPVPVVEEPEAEPDEDEDAEDADEDADDEDDIPPPPPPPAPVKAKKAAPKKK